MTHQPDFHTLLPPEFETTLRGRAFWRGKDRHDAATRLFGWQDLNAVLDMSSHAADAIKLVRNGENLTQAAYMRPAGRGPAAGKDLIPAAVSRALREGYSMVLNYLPAYHSGVRRLCDQLTAQLAETVNINGYVSWCEEQCFPTHWDSHDVLVIQAAGSKNWTVYRPTRPFPMERDAAYHDAPENLDEVWSGVLEAGQRLYIPRGWWHKASAEPGGSIHLTCGFTNQTGASLIRYLADLAARDPAFRADLPRPGMHDEATAVIAELGEKLSSLLEQDLLSRFWSAHGAELAVRRTHSLPHSITSQSFNADCHRYVSTALAPQLKAAPDKGEVTLVQGGRALVFDQNCEPALRHIIESGAVTAEALAAASGWDRDTVSMFVFELLGEGVLAICSPDHAAHSAAAAE